MMTELALLRLCNAQSRLSAALLAETPEPGSGERFERLIPLFIDVCDDGCQALESLRTALFFKKIKKPQGIGQIARDFLPGVITVLEQFRSGCRQASRSQAPPRRFEEFEAAVKRFRAEAIEFLMKWPWVNLENFAEAEAAYQRGDYRDAREALSELLHQALERG